MELLLKNANIVTDEKTYISDIYIKDGVINKIGENIDIPNIRIVDIKGKIVFQVE